MAVILFVKPAEMSATTILGGNVDPDKYEPCMELVQDTVIEPLLGTELYDKIKADYESASLTGKYLTLFDDYVKPITKYETVAEFVEISNFMVDNGGTFKHSAEDREATTKDETYNLSGKYHSYSQTYIDRFKKWICKNNLPEYKRYQDEVNAQEVQARGGWFFPRGSVNINGINECDL